MKKERIAGWSLLFCSAAMIAGMIVNAETYWFAADVAVIVITAVNGIALLRKHTRRGQSV